MIPKINPRGHSFKGVVAYLSHDKGELESAERVAWHETGNLPTNDPERAVKVMAHTDLHREEIRAANGTSSAGRKAETGNVWHASLSWALGENPSPDHQRETMLSFLEKHGLSEHEYILFGHNDTDHVHAHVVVNLVHPDTGLVHDTGLDKRHSQEWALDYEREHGIHCEQRVENARKRELGSYQKYRDVKQDYAEQVTRAYYASDNGQSFIHALREEGLELAKARRGNANYVIVDARGEIQKLSRQLRIEEKGKLKTEAIRAKLADLDRETIPDADQLANEIKTSRRELEAAEKTPQAEQETEPEAVNPESYMSDQEQKNIDAAIEAEKRRMAEEQREREIAKDARWIAKQKSFAESLDARREMDARHQRRRNQLEERLKELYTREETEKQLSEAQGRAAWTDTFWGRLTGKHRTALEDVWAYQKNLESITQRETEQRQALENQIQAERRQFEEPQASKGAPEPQKTRESVPRYRSARDLVDDFERSAGAPSPTPGTKQAEPSRRYGSASEMITEFKQSTPANDNSPQQESPELKRDKGSDYGGYER